MNTNLKHQKQTIKDWLNDAYCQLLDIGVKSPKLDAELIISHALGKNRTYIHAHSNDPFEEKYKKTANKYLSQRLNRVPIAYIIGQKEFYFRNFIVSPSTLIPRPESEDIILLLKLTLKNRQSSLNLIDVGTGCGCLGITAKLEFPKIHATLSDISNSALSIAKQNAKNLSADVDIKNSDLLENNTKNVDIILANLPYIDKKWNRSVETIYEPSIALYAENNGLLLIEKLISQASKILNAKGLLLIEADPCQHNFIIQHAKQLSLKKIQKLNYVISFERITSDLLLDK